jgi:isocitrate dehydrogenase
MSDASTIIYTWTDEAPALATLSLLPIVKAFAGAAGVEVDTADISLAGRILSAFPERLAEDQRVPDYLTQLGQLAKTPEANIIKLPNISASLSQMKEAIAELQSLGYDVPDYIDEPTNDAETEAQTRYDKLKGSAVNPVLREGNSDRRAPRAVKKYAQKNPHSMGSWSPNSLTHVSTMGANDFASNELSATMPADGGLRIEHVATDGTITVLKERVPVLAGEVVDTTFMSASALRRFLAAQIADAKQNDVLFSLHVKATMMKIADPIIFGHAVKEFFGNVFESHGEVLDDAGVNVNNGFASLLSALSSLDGDTRAAVEASIADAYNDGPDVAMVNSDRGITNLHVPSDVIVDASMPAMIRTSGQMWNKAGELQDTKAVIPDSSYAQLYQATIEFCKEHGAFDPTTMGTVPNVGLMAQKAEEYGSHDKTFELESAGVVRVIDDGGETVFEHEVGVGDVWRMCQAKDAPIRDWVKLGVNRARATGWPAVFWLDENRAHDAQLIEKINAYLPEHDTDGLDIKIMNVSDATSYTLDRVKRGENTVSITGNVLRDYLTDLFPILELGTSAKMLSIVPLMDGGGMFETGAGGSAPKHVEQFQIENHLRWDSLGEFLAIAVSLDHLADAVGNNSARVLGNALDDATEKLLDMGRSPSRKVNEIDNRGSHFYLALYWAEALAAQTDDAGLAQRFGPIAAELGSNEERIVEELIRVQGAPMDIGGYYVPDLELGTRAMRPSTTLNAIIDAI